MPEQKRSSFLSKIATGAISLFFRLLYHSFAWSYDLVAAVVSFGQWKSWVKTVLPLVSGRYVLELGFGPGHMQTYLKEAGFISFGLDESPQMASQARQRLGKLAQPARLARGLAQHLPFADRSFDSLIATFPTLYIVDPETLSEIYRVLKDPPLNQAGAQVVVLMAVWITGQSLPRRLLRWVYQVTGETPPDTARLNRLIEPFAQAGFQASIRFQDLPHARLMFILARKLAD
jgi:ubiquinone/menaquinone biosynthesis C-methylase UbiE